MQAHAFDRKPAPGPWRSVLLLVFLSFIARADDVPSRVEVSPHCAPLRLEITSHPWYTLHPDDDSRPFIAMCRRMVASLMQQEGDRLVVKVKPPWPMHCNWPWVGQLLRSYNRMAFEAVAENARKRGMELTHPENLIFCSENLPDDGHRAVLKVMCRDGQVQGRGRFEVPEDFAAILGQLHDNAVVDY